jgi:hypothetical protein
LKTITSNRGTHTALTLATAQTPRIVVISGVAEVDILTGNCILHQMAVAHSTFTFSVHADKILQTGSTIKEKQYDSK